MKKQFALILALVLLCAGCAGGPSEAGQEQQEDTLHILATTYPVYLFTKAVTQQAQGVEVTRLITQEVSCLHDYTLTVNDMKAIERADIIVMNGAGLEDFMDDALASSDAPVIDCSEGIELLPAPGHEGHNHDTGYDPHIWMDPSRAAQMIENIGAGLAQADPAQAEGYEEQARSASFLLENWYSVKLDIISSDQPDLQLPHRELITFHDGFEYFAQAFDLELLKSIEEEEGSEASAADISEIIGLIGSYDLPAIFTEVNGSDATAQAIARETGVQVLQLDLVMSGDGEDLNAYTDAMDENLKTIINALSEGQVRAE